MTAVGECEDGAPLLSSVLLEINPRSDGLRLAPPSTPREVEGQLAMAAWRLVLRTPSCPSGRPCYLLANDVTVASGSFGPQEDELFARVARAASLEGVPLLYHASNSGARMGLARDVQARFKVAWVDDAQPTLGIDYLYLSETDMRELGGEAAAPVRTERREVAAPASSADAIEVRHVLHAVIGSEDGLGVESLMGSAKAATAFSRAYDETFTLTYVSGLSVGIGAYLARLGRRVIQRQDASIILTGAAALNKLLGREVYANHHQLGGPRIHAHNGLSHMVVEDDKQGFRAMLQWLEHIPAFLTRSADPAQRSADGSCSLRAIAFDASTASVSDPRPCSPGAAVPDLVLGTAGVSPPLPIVRHAPEASAGPTSYAKAELSNTMRHLDAALARAHRAGGDHTTVDGAASGTQAATAATVHAYDALLRPPPCAPELLKNTGGAAAGSSPPEPHELIPAVVDDGSFVELMESWAQTVVVGRATLGGIPVGVIATQVTAVTKVVPGDPGLSDSATDVDELQAGQVWYPDSAAKTAQALEDMAREALPVVVFACWRGFSGGRRDLYEGILQHGSGIVEALRTYEHPVTVYIPPSGELRGGAWVVIDTNINPDKIEVYADPSARGSILEPEGLIEIKLSGNRLDKAAQRFDTTLAAATRDAAQLSAAGDAIGAARASQKALARMTAAAPAYRAAAARFAALHDVPERMLAKGAIRGIVPLQHARAQLGMRLRRRVLVDALMRALRRSDPDLTPEAIVDTLRAAFLDDYLADEEGTYEALASRAWENDSEVARWAMSERAHATVDAACMRLRRARARRMHAAWEAELRALGD